MLRVLTGTPDRGSMYLARCELKKIRYFINLMEEY